jgi:predicted ATP-binding protein involved in virulence
MKDNTVKEEIQKVLIIEDETMHSIARQMVEFPIIQYYPTVQEIPKTGREARRERRKKERKKNR